MARRSATNERYQKYTGPKGQTRKSASQAKPKRASADTTSKPKPSGGKSAPARVARPESPAYKAARKLWWTLLGAGLVMTAVSWLVRGYVHTSWANGASAIALGLAYTAIFYALYIDWTKLRPERQAAIAASKSGKTAKGKDA